MTLLNTLARKYRIQPSVTCPHCWEQFPPENILWVATHQDLKTDRKLQDASLRFLPTRYDSRGNALDAKDFACDSLACPKCHLGIHRGLIEIEPIFCSIIGTPSCGKSYYLAALIHKLRQSAFNDHFLQFGDLDPAANAYLNDIEEQLFLSPDGATEKILAQLVVKTGDKVKDASHLYNTVHFGDQEVVYTKPYQFLVTLRQHAAVKNLKNTTSRVVCLYDNAGEHYLAVSGNDSVSTQVTRHLAQSKFMFFLFDPSQDVRFWNWAIEKWKNKFYTPNESEQQAQTRLDEIKQLASERRFRQDTVLQEAAGRVRRLLGLGQQKKHNRHLIVIVTKADLWAEFLPKLEFEKEPFKDPVEVKIKREVRDGDEIKQEQEVIAKFLGLDLERLERVSNELRRHMREHCADLVLAAENFCEQVTYIPVSALGNSPKAGEVDILGKKEIAAKITLNDIKPRWVTIPFIYALHKYAPQLMLKAVQKPGR